MKPNSSACMNLLGEYPPARRSTHPEPTVSAKRRVALLIPVLLACMAAEPNGSRINERRDWPQWRGPDRTDVSRETGLLKEWPSGGPPIAWKVKGLGEGFSTPSIAKGRVFLMGNVGSDECILALNEADGQQ